MIGVSEAKTHAETTGDPANYIKHTSHWQLESSKTNDKGINISSFQENFVNKYDLEEELQKIHGIFVQQFQLTVTFFLFLPEW